MNNLDVLDASNNKVGDIEISQSIIETVPHPHAVKTVVTNYLAGRRAGTHKTKGRSEVSGSTRKLFKQKGTGNARMGSSRSPIRRHGGVSMGPVVRDYSYTINKKEKKLALCSVLAEKIRSDKVVILNELSPKTHSTKAFHAFVKQWEAKTTLIVSHDLNRNLVLASNNLPNVKLLSCRSVNVFDMLKFEKVIFTENALKYLEQLLSK